MYIYAGKHTLLHSFIRRVIKSPGGMGFKRRLGGLHASLVIIITSFDKNIVPTTSLKQPVVNIFLIYLRSKFKMQHAKMAHVLSYH